jgi:hypothetical protein
LGYIAHVNSIASILELGILSHNEIHRLGIEHESVAEPTVQTRRHSKSLSSGGWLHDFANLYINPRNAMLYRVARRFVNDSVVLSVDKCVLDDSGVRIVSRNAAVGEGDVEDKPVPEGLRELDRDVVFARGWKSENSSADLPTKDMLMAEVLVPERVQPDLITGAWVATQGACERLADRHPRIRCSWDGDLFFGLAEGQ